MTVAASRARAGGTPLGVWLDLLSCASIIEGEVRGRLRREFDTTLPRFELLAELSAAARSPRGGLTMSELSRRLMVTNGNVTGLADRLAQEGLVSRTTSPTDGRLQVLRITRAGKRALSVMAPAHRAWISRLFSGLTREERARLNVLIGKLKHSIISASASEGAR